MFLTFYSERSFYLHKIKTKTGNYNNTFHIVSLQRILTMNS